MKKLYDKSELHFSLAWIIGYVVLFSVADSFSESLGFEKIVTAPIGVVLVLFLFLWMKKHDLLKEYGLCAFQGNWKHYLYFLPLLILMSVNLWNGVTMKVSAGETVIFILSMLCVGFLEEIIFRGFLFKAICQNNVKSAIVVSSVTFGIGHIVNLLNGADFLPTLLQICYAIAIGFLFTIIFYKGKSLLPCILTHGVLNSLSIFAIQGSRTMDIVTAIVICVICAGYVAWILKKGK
ncbi:MAG: CPBP family intramembrane metalloprotease [Blautia sp.]|nr:CPBP family intramembrane metalloprotease [Lachnoclostridium sp.]MCM1211325.1 CPBP family intramembrane metalloprotease [Blautia sp.]